MKIYAGNLSYSTNDTDLERAFSAYGAVQSAQVIVDRDTGRSKGFGFVEMGDSAEAQQAIAQLNGAELQGRTIKVNEAKPRENRDTRDRGPRRRY